MDRCVQILSIFFTFFSPIFLGADSNYDRVKGIINQVEVFEKFEETKEVLKPKCPNGDCDEQFTNEGKERFDICRDHPRFRTYFGKWERCNRYNNYLENQWSKQFNSNNSGWKAVCSVDPFSGPPSLRSSNLGFTPISEDCIFEAQLTRVSREKKCGGEFDLPKDRYLTPCRSPTYVNWITRAYNTVAYCFDQNPKILFSMFAVESGFHPTNKSSTGCTGIGQLCGALSDMNSNYVKRVGEGYMSSRMKSPPCNELSKLMPPEAPATKDRCGVATQVEGTVRNLVISMGYYLHNMATYFGKKRIRGSNSIADKLGRMNLSNENKQKLMVYMGILAHNGGAGASYPAFSNYLGSYMKRINDDNFSIAFDFGGTHSRESLGFPKFVNHARANLTREAGGYLSMVKLKSRAIETRRNMRSGQCTLQNLF